MRDIDVIGLLAIGTRTDAAKACLAGNDTGCFTTEQYQQAYDRICKRDLGWPAGLAERHLRSIPNVVQEASPGIWRAV